MAEQRFVNVRKLAAFNLYYRNGRAALYEFGFAVFGLEGLGVLAVFFPPKHSLPVEAIGAYLIILGIDYLPLFAYGLALSRQGDMRKEITGELADESRFKRKYGVQQALVMVPLAIPSLALSQALRRNRD